MRAASAILCPWILCFASVVAGQDYVLTATNASGMVGATVDVDVQLDNVQPVRGLTFGLAHDGSVANLTTITEGAASLLTNSGAGADFVHINAAAANGPGGLYGMVVSTEAPIEEIPVGSAQTVARFTYQLTGVAGDSTAIDFSSTLGAPPVVVVLSVAGVSFVPVQNSGSIQIETPPVVGLTCAISDPCTCAALISWTNPIAYDAITVLVDGVVAATTTSDSATVTLPVGVAADVCVVGSVQGVDAVATCCSITCPTLPTTTPPQALNCVIDDVTCEATLTWTNPEAYASIDVQVDGSTVQSLGGSALNATVSLAGAGSYQICLAATDGCGLPVSLVCCSVSCTGPPPQFVRGDNNGDGMLDLSDPILTLGYLFLGATTTCLVAMDVNDSGGVNTADAVYHLTFLFLAGAIPPAPFPSCGDDLTPDTLTCDAFATCP
ncbi:MAG: hypothetical protein AAF581_17980 [Planctomycetota bacterium]